MIALCFSDELDAETCMQLAIFQAEWTEDLPPIKDAEGYALARDALSDLIENGKKIAAADVDGSHAAALALHTTVVERVRELVRSFEDMDPHQWFNNMVRGRA